MPVPQGEHTDAPGGDTVPAGHMTHVEAPTIEKWPAGQGAHASDISEA